MTQQHDVKNRRGRLGSSDVAAILGLDPYRTPTDVWMTVTGQAEPFEGNEHTDRGNVMEPAIMQLYQRRHGDPRAMKPGSWVHPDHPFLVAHPDYIVQTDGLPRLAEIKCPARMDKWGLVGSEDVPDQYYAQTVFQHALADAGGIALDDEDHLVAFCGDLHVYPLTYNKARGDNVVQQCVDWWQRHVVTNEPPEPQNEADCHARWVVTKGRTVPLDFIPEAMSLVQQYRQMAEEMKALEERKKALRMGLLEVLQGATAATIEGERVISYAEVNQHRFNTKKFKEEHPEMHADYLERSTHRRMTVR